MRWSQSWLAGAGVFSVVAAIGGAAFAVAGSAAPSSEPGTAGKEVCTGKPLGAVASPGPAGVTSDRLPVGTSLRLTNLANGRAITVPVTGASSGCAVLNSAAFDALRSAESDTALRRVRVEIVGNAPAPTSVRAATSRVRASGVVGQVVCEDAAVGLSAVGGAPGAFSSQLPVGTSVRVTNLDNGRQATVRIVGVGPACVLLNSAAFALVGESGTNTITRAQIEMVT
ncbi:hypothetical protein [Lentzea sp. NPDC060358]|uniref:hypothetical protein n=1 Tax=Lentzea sp. NPDC060358 TaxID=3347103 RepID=UPI00366615A4